VDGTTNWSADTVKGTASTGTTAWLADIVGSRTVTITASDGSETSDPASFTFGKGPLSVFSRVSESGVQWATNYINNTTSGFQTATTPAAFFCSGSNVNTAVTTKGNASSTSSGFNPDGGNSDWSNNEEKSFPYSSNLSRYAINSKLAQAKQLLKVAGTGGYSADSASKKAANAAGWSLSFGYVWSGEVQFEHDFLAPEVNLSNGTIYWKNVTETNKAAVCVP
jgi:hypothetical protein